MSEYQFEPPTYEAPMPTTVRPLNYFRLTYAASIVRVNGALAEVRSPSTDLLTAAGEEGVDYFLGGRVYTVSGAAASDLQAAGYALTALDGAEVPAEPEEPPVAAPEPTSNGLGQTSLGNAPLGA